METAQEIGAEAVAIDMMEVEMMDMMEMMEMMEVEAKRAVGWEPSSPESNLILACRLEAACLWPGRTSSGSPRCPASPRCACSVGALLSKRCERGAICRCR